MGLEPGEAEDQKEARTVYYGQHNLWDTHLNGDDLMDY